MTETSRVTAISEQGGKEKTQHDNGKRFCSACDPVWRMGFDIGRIRRAGAQRPRPNPEVVARAKRRRFTAGYKQKILADADAAKRAGNPGALLRQEGLYSSLLVTWRREREAGILKGLTPRKRGPKAKADPLAGEYQKLQRKNELLAEQPRKAEIVIDVQKKVAALPDRAFPETETL